jgi:HNH endonuclease/NUMOD4 motif
MPVVGYETFYEISSEGRLRSFDRLIHSHHGGSYIRPGRILKPGISANKYLVFCFCNNSSYSTKSIHRMVALTFLGPGKGREVNHKDCNRMNNRVANLEWVSKRENLLHAVNNGKWPDKYGNIRNTVSFETKELIRAERKTGSSFRFLAKKYGVSCATTYRICNFLTLQ